MTNFFRRNQKKLLAVFAAGLMIVFILPSTCGQQMNEREDPVIAYAGKDKIRASELGAARSDWDMLRRIPVQSPRMAMQMGMPWYQPIPYAYQLGTLAMEIEQAPELFLLLQKDADRAGIKVAPDRVDSAMREINISPNISAEERQRWQRAIEAFLRVKSLHDRVTSNVKISEPVIAHQLAQNAQEVKLNLVEFATGAGAESTTAPTTAPTTQELEAHFQKFANRPADLPSTNPAVLTFGYQRPDRVKLQYLAINKDQVREAVRKSKAPYDWEVLAQRYYISHQQEFPVTQPVTQPATTTTTQATQPATAAATKPATKPTTRPFAEVREDVMKRVMDPEVEKLTQQIRDAIAKRMAADWEKQRPATNPATNPATTQPGGYGSFAYLEQLSADIQKEFGVLPAVTSKSEWLSADELSALPGIGTARGRTSGQSFANYVLQSAEPFMPVPEKADAAAVLSVLEPSQPIEDFNGNVYLFRLTDAQRAHPPASLAEVRDQVEADYRAGRAFEKAVEDARKFLDAAKKNGLVKAAAEAKKPVVATGTISRGMYGMPPTTIPNYPTSAPSVGTVAAQAYKLLVQASPDAPHPLALIELPDEKKVVVAELGEVTSLIPEETAYLTRLGVAHQMAFKESQDLAAEWFTEDAVKARLGYRSVNEDDKPKDATKTASAS